MILKGTVRNVIDFGAFVDIGVHQDLSLIHISSGTGSCAAAVTAYKLGLTENRVNVNQPGGMIQIDIHEDGTIYMTGSVGYVADMSVAESFFS